MTCGHCVAAVTEEVRSRRRRAVDVVLEAGGVTVTSRHPLERRPCEAAVTEAGYALA